MLTQYACVRRVSRAIEAAAGRTIDAYNAHEIADEENLSGRLIGAIQTELDHLDIGGVTWHTISTVRGQERRIGADFISILDIDLDHFRVQKGVMIQAKRIGTDGRLISGGMDRLLHQCAAMLNVTSESYVMLYHPNGIGVVPALSVMSWTGGRSFWDLYVWSLRRFYEAHAESFIGDARLRFKDFQAGEYPARQALVLQARRAY